MWFIPLIAVGFQWPDQAAEMQSNAKLNCNKLNVIQLRKKSFPSSFSYLLRYIQFWRAAWRDVLWMFIQLDVFKINCKCQQKGKNASFILSVQYENSYLATQEGFRITCLLSRNLRNICTVTSPGYRACSKIIFYPIKNREIKWFPSLASASSKATTGYDAHFWWKSDFNSRNLHTVI